METRTLAEGGPRIKFKAIRKGCIEDFLPTSVSDSDYPASATELTNALQVLTHSGATPILPDGKLAGNGAVCITSSTHDYLVVSKSGKTADEKCDPVKDTCIVTKFSRKDWEAEYYSSSEYVLPTSDTPLHYCLLNAYKRFSWTEVPTVALHGHALDSMEDARRLGLPCSPEETLFSTPEDLEALLDLACQHPYPANKIFIRRGHGFFILGRDIADAMNTFKAVVEPYLCESKIHPT